MLTYLDYILYSPRGDFVLCGYTNTCLPVKTISTDIVRKMQDIKLLEIFGHRIFHMPIKPTERGNLLFGLNFFISINSTF